MTRPHPMRSTLADVDVCFQTSTPLAVCVRAVEGGPDVWLPLSQCEIDGWQIRGETVTVTADERLLIEKGLV